MPCEEVDLQFARDEGEGFKRVAAWGSQRTSAFGRAWLLLCRQLLIAGGWASMFARVEIAHRQSANGTIGDRLQLQIRPLGPTSRP